MSLPPCLILGGGLGSRMRPATDVLPKPLLPVADQPFVVHQLRWLASEGVTDVVYSIGYLGHLIRDELSHRDDLGCSVRFVDEGSRRLGTGGAVRFAVDEAQLDEDVLVLYGDSYLDVPIGSVVGRFAELGVEALMTVYPNDGRWDASNARFDGRWIVRYDKHEPDPAAVGMHHIDYGLSLLRTELVRSRIPSEQPSDLADLMGALSIEGRLAGYEAPHRYFEIGSPTGLADLHAHLTPRP